MKTRLFAVLAAVTLSATALFAADATAFQTEFRALVEEIRGQLSAGKDTAGELADELKRFETLLEKHRATKSDEVAQATVMYAMLQLQLGNSDKAIESVKRVKADFPDSPVAKDVDRILASIEKQAKAKEIQAKLSVGSQFPEFNVEDMNGKPLNLADYQGKVTLIDFWATWCGPCIAELPHVLKAYEKHHTQGFEIIGISLDNAGDREKLAGFVKDRNMPWRQYFDGKGWNNELAAKYGIQSIPATFLLDRTGKIIGKDLRGDELEKAVAKALAAK